MNAPSSVERALKAIEDTRREWDAACADQGVHVRMQDHVLAHAVVVAVLYGMHFPSEKMIAAGLAAAGYKPGARKRSRRKVERIYMAMAAEAIPK